MRSSFVSLYLMAVGAMFAGCATTASTSQRFALWKPPTAEAKEKKETKPAGVAKTDNPFRKQTAANASTDSAKSSNSAKGENGIAEAGRVAASETTSKDAGLNGAFSPETLRLIDAELADATPDERSYWYDQLKRVDAAVIPSILQARRLSADVADQRPAEGSGRVVQAKGDDWAKESSSVVQAAGRKFPGDPAELNRTLQNSDGLSVRQQMIEQGYASPDSATGKGPFAVQRVPDNPVQSPAGQPSQPSGPRNALSRFLPSGRNTGVVQASANAPSTVSLMPPTGIGPAAGEQSQLDSLISLVEADVATLTPGGSEERQTEYIRRHVYLRLLYLMADHPERALTAIPGIDSADQEFWQQMLWSMTNYFDVEHLSQAKDRAGQAVAQLATATQRLRERSDLELRNLAFCREIAYYGNFVRFPRDEFHPGDSALLYAEVENFKSELTVDGHYRTLLRSTVEILSPSGEVRWHKEFPATEDLCVNYRRDYFHNYQFSIPDRLPIGPHTLKLTVFDELSGKMVSQSINFVVR